MLKKKSVIIEWGISYALVLVVPLLAIFINYSVNVRTIKREIDQAYQLILDNFADNIDRLMENEMEMFSWFYLDEAFLNLAYSETVDAQFVYDAFKFQKQFEKYVSINDMFYWLYLEDKDYIICSEGANSSQKIYNGRKVISTNISEFKDWQAFLRDEYVNEYLVYDGLFNKKKEKFLVYANSWNYFGDVKANIFITTPVSKIEELVKTMPKGAFFTIMITNESAEVAEKLLVLNSEGLTELPGDISTELFADKGGAFDIPDYKCLSMASGNDKMTYLLLIPQENYWKEAEYVRNIHLFSILSAMLIGIGLVIFLLRKNFRPVSGLLLKLGDAGKGDNEFQRMEAVYDMMRHEHSVMKKTIQNQENVLKGSYLLSYLKGRKIKMSNRELEMWMDIPFERGMFALIGFYVPVKKEERIEDDELNFFVVNNVFAELMDKEKFYLIEDGRFLFYLFCFSAEHVDQWKKESIEKLDYLCEFLDEKFQLNILAAISTVESDFSQAKLMYQNVMSAFEYKRMLGGSGVISVEELNDLEFDENKQFHDCNIMLAQALKNGDQEQACGVSRRLFASMEQMPFIAQRLHILEAFQVVVDCYNSDIIDSVKRMQLLLKLEDLLNADALTIKVQFDEILTFACAKLKGQWKKEDKGIVKSVKEYVEANYADNNLDLSMIAEAVRRNPRYISKIFKEETGEGILDYVNILRIRKAQEILLTRSISIEELTETVGYVSTRTFRRYFSKITGTTPGAYLEKN